MKKRITSLLLCFVMVFTMLAAAVPALAAGSTSFNIKPDKTEARPGDTISYTISLGAATNLRSIKIKLSIPEGLTYVAGSGKTPDGLEATLNNAQKAAFTESTKVFIVATAAGYTSTTETLLMEFKCTVNEGASGNKAIDLIIDPDDIFDTDYDNIGYVVNSPAVNITTPHTHVYDQTNTDAAHLKTPATCTEAAVYYKSCTCGENGTETFTSGSALGHDYTKKVENNTYLKTAASNCTEYNVYWYACSRCDANAKDDAEATDKYYTSTTAGNHSFTEQIADEAHYVAGTGTNCQSVKQYYYDCAYCNQKGTTTWDSTTYGPHNYAATWSSDADGHWHACQTAGCTEKRDFATHTPDHTGHATEEYAIKCTECGYVIEAQLGHTHVFDKEVATDAYKATDATCTAKATYYKSCTCGEKGTATFEYGELAEHNWAPATCTAPKTCSVCQATEGDPLGHTGGTEWKYNSTSHWHECAVCGAETDEHQDHQFDGGKTCVECGYTKGSTIVILDPVDTEKPDLENPGTGAAVSGSGIGYACAALAVVGAIYVGAKKLAKKDEE